VDGLARTVGQEALIVVVNTADDGDFHGLRVCPDLDICTYVLAGVVAERGWGYAEDTFRLLEGLRTYGRPTWFGLGDRDLATHLHRTLLLAEGATLSEATADIARRLGVRARVLPMCDEPVRTRIRTRAGERSFQEYLVEHGASEEIESITVDGVEEARPAPGVLEALAGASHIVICPSSPIVSIGSILAVPGVRAALAARRGRVVAVSPLVGGRPVEGPGCRFLAGAGYPECTATQMARLYADVAGTLLIHSSDADEMPAIAHLGLRPVACDILMPDRPARARLAARCLSEIAA
jgi:LPPG:FO 2-phospho-L-lactate transferase